MTGARELRFIAQPLNVNDRRRIVGYATERKTTVDDDLETFIVS